MIVALSAEDAANIRHWSQFSDAKLDPRPLEDGRFAVPVTTLTDRRFAGARRLIAKGATVAESAVTFAATSDFRMSIDSKQVYLSAAPTPHAFSAPGAGVYRFETRRNESGYAGDAANGNRRSELVAGIDASDRYGAGETLWSSFAFVVGPQKGGLDAGGALGLVHQWHSVDTGVSRAPVLGVSLDGGNLRIYTRSDATGTATQNHYTAPRPPDGTVHRVVVAGTLGASGHLNVWLDGTQIVNVNTPIGYYNDDAGARDLAYPHVGLYQNNFDAPTVVFITNWEWGTTDLSARVASPRPVTAPASGWV